MIPLIVIDPREQKGAYIKSRFDAMEILSAINTLPYETGCDYLISNSHGSCAIQRKDAMAELINQMEDLQFDILPRLSSFHENPILLVEERFVIGEKGYMFRWDDTKRVWFETGMHSASYYAFLEHVRLLGVNVVCTRDLDHSIWYMAAMDKFLSIRHYPKQAKCYGPYEQAIGMLCCIPGVGVKRAEEVLSNCSIADIPKKQDLHGLTKTQGEKLKKVLRYKHDDNT